MSSWKKKRNITNRYDITADMYDMRYAEEQLAKMESALDSLELDKEDVILDVGCGTGLFFAFASRKTQTVVGLDVSPSMLRKARKRAKTLQNVSIVLADADHMPFRSDFFNGVFAFTMLQNSPNPKATLAEMTRVSSSGATFVVTGMKKSFSPLRFRRLLSISGLKTLAIHSRGLQCRVAVCRLLR